MDSGDDRLKEPLPSLDGSRVIWRRLLPTFASDALEADYWQASRQRTYTFASAYVAVIAVGLALFAIQDYRLLGWGETFARLAALRLLLIAVSIATLVTIRRQPDRRRLEFVLMLWALTIIAGHGMIASTRPIGYLVGIVNARAALMLGFLMVPSAWVVLAPASVVLAATYTWFIAAATPASAEPLLLSSWLFLVVTSIAAFWAVQYEKVSRGHFAALRSEMRAREELAVARAAADRSSHAKTEFLATMSHEIRTPLNGVIGFANLLSESPLTDEQRQYASIIRGSGERLLVIINDILDFSKIEAGHVDLERTAFDLGESLQDVMHLMSLRADEKRLTLSLHVDTTVPPAIVGDSARLRQVLVNLVGNALKFTDTGSVRVTVHCDPNGSMRFDVIDTGIGLTSEEMRRLFRRFSQADASTTRRFGGTGLGLAICKRLVELMGGTIGVESRKGEGSRFWFTLPVVTAELAPRGPASSPVSVARPLQDSSPAPAARAPRVLLAEDNPTNQLLARHLLTQLGCTVDMVVNGRDVLERWDTSPYDVIFMDCQMPILDGFEATAEIRRRELEAAGASGAPRPRVHIVACSAGVMPSERAHCFAVGMDDFVAKPFDREDLRRALERAGRAALARTAA